ncbi:MAG: ABC transporter ATP-binding protein [Tissierellia bacterium]|nr:ABC transporter ATP-binding protein [Tissierellia bacterium]
MISIFKQFESFIGKDKNKFRKAILLSIFESMLGISKIIAIYLILQGIIENRLNMSLILQAFLIMAIAIIISIALKAKSSMLQTEVGYDVAARKRMDIGEHLKYVPMGYFSKKSLGQITSIATNSCNNVQEVATLVMMYFTTGLVEALIMTIFLLKFNLGIGFVSIAALIYFFIIINIINKIGENLSERKLQVDSRLVEKTLEYIQGMQIVKSFNLRRDTNSEYIKEIENSKKINTNMEKAFIPWMFILSFGIRLLAVLIVYLSIRNFIFGKMLNYESIVLIIAAFLLFAKLETAGSFVALFKLLKFTMNQINEVEEIPVMDIDGQNIKPNNYDICFENVDFAYQDELVINDVSFKIKENTTTAIIGPSGGGKTTITKLLARFWDVDSGKITLGDRNIKDYKLDALWDNISVVFQDVYLFNDTVANNIKFGSPNKTREEVIEAAKKAHCYEFIMNMEKGFDTIIGEGGASVSGGEAQRISFARAIMKDAPIIILDEATANIDPENENLVQDAIEELTRKKTVIMIAHRLKTVKSADQILVLNKGKIEAKGTHEELMKRDGIYRDFVNMREKTIGWKIES